MKRIQLVQGHITLSHVHTVEDHNAPYLGYVENKYL